MEIYIIMEENYFDRRFAWGRAFRTFDDAEQCLQQALDDREHVYDDGHAEVGEPWSSSKDWHVYDIEQIDIE